MQHGDNAIPQEENISTNDELVEEERASETHSLSSIGAIVYEDENNIDTQDIMGKLNMNEESMDLQGNEERYSLQQEDHE